MLLLNPRSNGFISNIGTLEMPIKYIMRIWVYLEITRYMRIFLFQFWNTSISHKNAMTVGVVYDGWQN